MEKSNARRTSPTPLRGKALKEGLAILLGEIELALQWRAPGILLAVHPAGAGRTAAQRALEKEIIQRGWRAATIEVGSGNPDAIRAIGAAGGDAATVFFVSGLDTADGAYRALNFNREELVEKPTCAVFWLNAAEAKKLPRLAPDFWAFRHRTVDFTPQRGSGARFLPAGIFLWQDEGARDAQAQKEKLAHYENLLARLPDDASAAASRIETLLRLAQYAWLLNDPERCSSHLNAGFALAERYPLPAYQAWLLNARGILLCEQGSKKEADACFAQALQHDPQNGAALMNAAVAAFALGRNQRALALAKRALKKEPRNARLQRAFGYLSFLMGKTEDAIVIMNTARELAPEDTLPRHALAVFRYRNNQRAESAGELAEALSISLPQNKVEAACVDVLNGKAEAALENLRHAVAGGEISASHVLRDPNLNILLDKYDLITFDRG